jgi:hypothetical protein
MEIRHVDGSVSDTDKLPDTTALVMEKVKELLDLCEAHKIPLLLRFSTHDGKHSGAHCALHPTKEAGQVIIELVSDWCDLIERFWPGCRVMIVHGEPPDDLDDTMRRLDEPPPPTI